MREKVLEICNLCARCEEKEILKDFSLTIYAGEIHAIMGPNGTGKSTLGKVLAGHPAYEVTSGSVTFMGQDLLALEVEERAKLGLFLSFQYPVEIAGVLNEQFLEAAVKAKGEITSEAFEALLTEKMALVGMREEFRKRAVNDGFSGGEKKRNEILQMALLNPTLAILDETDSGLDVDAMRVIAAGVNALMDGRKALIIITHYPRLLELIAPHFVHVMSEGKIVNSGSFELAKQVELSGYA
jgi:Fe-S cluster assembly ATP-binding protein